MAPICEPRIPPMLLMLMMRAYMVPSIPSGHSLEAITMMGIVATHPTTLWIALSPRQKNQSGMWYLRFQWNTRMRLERPSTVLMMVPHRRMGLKGMRLHTA
eukprot:CAMPEP_0206276790 /NCGR_PEP_ID=MMETSP0047_2-20121206/36494_1 /ASSEMBLY_ACC=CAM_ASM_000192 /TAXON_ID=195065 /ORGANISM="Chroomonas mesostigmatica_cf, Strain CCMP1168" /LENGTH=100 /DNA_ID=CAMNT_0053706331 /DNA_START=293 /DNA_END=595 /DNA_ORIENTATION=+